jgi:hypothetical protein
MTVTYAGQTWTRNISDWIAKSGTTNFSLSMTASTGEYVFGGIISLPVVTSTYLTCVTADSVYSNVPNCTCCKFVAL